MNKKDLPITVKTYTFTPPPAWYKFLFGVLDEETVEEIELGGKIKASDMETAFVEPASSAPEQVNLDLIEQSLLSFAEKSPPPVPFPNYWDAWKPTNVILYGKKFGDVTQLEAQIHAELVAKIEGIYHLALVKEKE